VKHADASSVQIEVWTDTEELCFQVSDNGRGMPTTETTAQGNGMMNMRRRAEDLGGSFEVEEGPDGGTRVTWRAPISQ